MKVEITIQCDNAAFEDDPGFEVSHILRKFAQRLDDGGRLEDFDETPLLDTNGNRVGVVIVHE